MAELHITKVAFGCGDVDLLRDRLFGRAAGGETFIDTRYRPTRAAELIGGSLFWIIRHRLVARSRILRFDEEGGRCIIRLAADLVHVRAQPRRAYQGWRYLAGGDAPIDFGEGADADEIALLPRHIADELTALALI